MEHIRWSQGIDSTHQWFLSRKLSWSISFIRRFLKAPGWWNWLWPQMSPFLWSSLLLWVAGCAIPRKQITKVFCSIIRPIEWVGSLYFGRSALFHLLDYKTAIVAGRQTSDFSRRTLGMKNVQDECPRQYHVIGQTSYHMLQLPGRFWPRNLQAPQHVNG